MALNGLDSAQVREAYEAVQSDAHSWFLLHYLTRDQVALLRQGTGGLDAVRAAILTYPEKSPIYGLFFYRESRILFKYIPEGTSRLLQVRTNVHFEAVIDHFSNFDAIFTAYAPEDFNDSAISASCFPKSGSIETTSKQSTAFQESGSASETGEEETTIQLNNNSRTSLNETHPAYREPMVFDTVSGSHEDRQRAQQDDISIALQIETLNLSSNVHEYDLTTASEVDSDEDVVEELPCIEDDVMSQTSSYRTTRRSGGSREYGQRHSGSDYINQSIENFEQLRPKVKLFPRPVTDVRTTRSATDGSTRSKLPAGLRRVTTKPEGERRPSRASKSPTSAKSHKSHKSRRDATRQQAPSTVGDFSLSQVREGPPPKAVSTPASVAQPPSVVAQNPIARAPSPMVAKQKSMSQIRPATAPQSAPMPQIQAQPAADFALLPHRPSTASSSGMKPWLSRTPSYDNANFSVMSTEKQRLMRVLELRKQGIAPTKTPDSVAAPVATSATSQPQQRSLQDFASSSKAISTTNNENPSMSFINQLMKPSAQNSLADENDGMTKQSDSSRTTSSRGIESSRSKDEEQHPEQTTPEKRHHKSQRDKRRATIEPIKTGQHWDRQYEESISDDSFMDELQNATVEEAKPMSFAQSPRSPLFSSDRGDVRLTSGSVTSVMIHSPSRGSLRQRPSELLLGGRSHSQLETIPAEQHQPLSEDPKTPTSVFQEPMVYPSQLDSIPDEDAFFHDQESVRQDSGSEDTLEAPAPPPEEYRAAIQPSQPRLPRQKNTSTLLKDAVHTFYNVTRLTKAEQPRNQVSVTKIERKQQPSDPRGHTRTVSGTTERSFAPLEPQISQQSMGNVRGGASQSGELPRRITTNELPRTRALPQPPSARKRQGAKPALITSLPRPSSSTDGGAHDTARNRLKVPHGKSKKPESSAKLTESETLKRMSAFPATTQHPPSQQQAEYLRDQNRASSWPQIAPPAVPIGDVEVQLPDTLLWKRRFVEVDGSGFISLGNTAEEGNRSLPRKYRLADYRTPVAPSKDREEVPFSIVLERSEGGNLQFACADARSHTLALRKLFNLHRAWVAFGQK